MRTVVAVTPEQQVAVSAYIQKVVDEAPPLTNAQRDALYLILHGGRRQPSRVSVETDAEREAREAERREAERRRDHERYARQVSQAALACAICAAPVFTHGPADHDWVARSPREITAILGRLIDPSRPE